MNASRVLDSFGAKTLAIVTSGGVNGQRLEKLAAKSGFPVKVVPIHNDSRVNLTITDKQGLALRLNEQGPLPGHASGSHDRQRLRSERMQHARCVHSAPAGRVTAREDIGPILENQPID